MSDDPDRDAILARRRRFIAVALSGLTAASSACPAPQPCLNVAQPEIGALPPTNRPIPPEESAQSLLQRAEVALDSWPGQPSGPWEACYLAAAAERRAREHVSRLRATTTHRLLGLGEAEIDALASVQTRAADLGTAACARVRQEVDHARAQVLELSQSDPDAAISWARQIQDMVPYTANRDFQWA